MTFMKKFFVIISIAAVHAVFTKTVSIVSLSVVTANAHESQLPLVGRSLMTLSRGLYFPVFTFAWYPRQFFPGNLVAFPLFINSLLWALALYLLFVLIKNFFKKKGNGVAS